VGRKWGEKKKNINIKESGTKTVREPHLSEINTPGLPFISFLAIQWYPNKVYHQEKEWCRDNTWRLLCL